jgi:tRNA 2-thiouridine synthesizing protein A
VRLFPLKSLAEQSVVTDSEAVRAAPIIIDARGLNCPLPLLKLKKAMAIQAAASRYVLLATDADSAVDIGKLARQRGYVLVTGHEADGVLRFELTRE